MSVTEVGCRGVSRCDRCQGRNTASEVAVVVVETGVADCYLLPTPVKTGDERGLNGIDSHMIPSLIVVHYKNRHWCDVCYRGVSRDVIDLFD